ncbi:MAG: 3-hydroxyisobutyrate dehydrogenase [Yaniella sp.]|uniref:3-hydroxyisobutyrate dehydrogenase n=1 Tax=Yaniella sp. TaxID=2773929 RepID=UPI0026494025|nr:3-hydroxyisobutyrate dehydrogenase [Yaniella sp.]MDN5730781.1 3-hydroxyisobutyrate dehydrogenase [Yaniella sp.]MDN5815275.1 3-hydroxyisobutyrate dehydrogenase [Yaniella sp.]MDN5816714.1 3-hydroxyisobutyrate dehydrogenase [Yaniella sp.]MDN5837661.1 3-hydroxyisobutyrate dehydrogenase [Yaniella sp.]MDN5888578.1 3-hydroxyisobutyrate dehydrogenase [Yaniella sp.]
MKIAFLGLGNMGSHMARNLVDAGYSVTGFDVVQAAIKVAAEHGVTPAETAEDAVNGADVVITMFPAGKHVLEAYSSGLLAAADPGILFIDSSTIAVDDAVQAAKLATDAGHLALDAPVSGGTTGAEKGTLTFMVGGSQEAFDKAKPLFDVMGRQVVHAGESGTGQAAKIVNNMALAINTIGTAEAFTLGKNLGLSHQTLYDVMSTSAAQSWSVTTNCPVPGPVPGSPASNDYRPGFATGLMAKDLTLAREAIESTNTPADFGMAAYRAYTEFNSEDTSGKDFSAIIATKQKG